MKTQVRIPVRYTTVRLIGRLLAPISEASSIITNPELNEIMSNLRHLAQKGEMLPDVIPKLLDRKEAAEMLGVSFNHFRDLEREGFFPFKKRKLGTSVRYYNIDLLKYILNLPEEANKGDNKDSIPEAV